MNQEELKKTANALVAAGKGILAADESTGTATKRLKSINVESTEDSRRRYRQTLFTTPGLHESISGVILYDETIRQKTDDGTPFPELMQKKGIIPGIKVDTGAKDMALHPGEKVTEGLDGLRGRLEEYHGMGARFAKWRAVITIGDGLPTRACLEANAHALARYAALCQEQGIVPIVEPEVLMNGDHSLDRADAVTRETWQVQFETLQRMGVYLPGILLKPSMIVPGKDSGEDVGREEVAHRTLAALRDHVPASVPGIVFLSGGQSPEEATEHLQEMNALGPHPWKISYSYGRALQEPALNAWGGKDENVKTAQAKLYHRGKMNSAAQKGEYSSDMEKEPASPPAA